MLHYEAMQSFTSLAMVHCHFFYPLLAAVPLSLKTLTLLKWRNEEGRVETFRLASRVSSEWPTFGTLLDQSLDQLNHWDSKHRGNSLNIWKEMMDHWLTAEGTEDYPATWEGLYSLLDDLDLPSIAAELRHAVCMCAKLN